MPEPLLPDKRAVRRSFERAAAGYDAAAHLQREIGERLLGHLDPMRLAPRRILELGCGTGATFEALRGRFPGVALVGLDLSLNMLEAARARLPWWRRALGGTVAPLVCADAERIPFASRSFELVISNLALQWCRPEAVFAESARILAEGGLLLFSTFGPDTLKELRSAFAAVDSQAHVNTFPDMHDLGDALVHAGLADPVMEMEMVTVEYASVEAIARDLKAVGAHNVLPGRPRGLSSRRRWSAMVERYEAFKRDEAYPATYEVVYGHAWKTAPRRLADGRQVVDFRPRSGS
jgi:malonyl-CoA O-methyltransferase